MCPAIRVFLGFILLIEARPVPPLPAPTAPHNWTSKTAILDPKALIRKCFCPAGYQPRRNCSLQQAAVCERCPSGFYSDAPSYNACRACAECEAGTYQVTPCAANHQTICTDINQLNAVCKDVRHVEPNPPDGDMPDYEEAAGPSNMELVVVVLVLAVVTLSSVLFYVTRASSSRASSRHNSRAVENADIFRKSGSIYQNDRNTETGMSDYRPLAGQFCSNSKPKKLKLPVLSNSGRESYFPPSTGSNKMLLDSRGFYQNAFSSEGGTLEHNEVAITICKLAVPRDQTYTIRGKTHTGLEEWNACVEPGDVIIAPPLELHVDGNHRFNDHVTVCIPHCLQDHFNRAAIRVFWGNRTSGTTFKPIGRMSEKNRSTEAFYVVDEDHVYIHTTHFNNSQFVCTISGGQIDLQLQMLVFYEHRVVADMQHLKVKLTFCDSRHTIPDLREAYLAQEGLPLVHSCSWKSLELPHGYTTPQTEVMVELIPDEDWEEAIYGEMKIPLRVNQKLVDVLNMQSNLLAEFSLKRHIVGKPASTFEGTLILAASEKIKEEITPLTVTSAGGVIRKEYLRGRGSTRTSIETCKSSKTEHPVSINLNSNETSASKSIPGKVEDGMTFIAQNLSSSEFSKFYRQLGVKPAEIDSIRERFRDDFHEQKMQMMLTWQQRMGKMASNRDLHNALRHIGLSKMAEELEMELMMAPT